MDKVIAHSLFTDFDIDLFRSGKHYRLYEKMGSQLIEVDGKHGTYFAVYAPSAKSLSVIGDFNFWNPEEHPLNVRWDSSGIWEGFIPNVQKGACYKYHIVSNHDGHQLEKGDPYAIRWEHPPKTASIVWEHSYPWQDAEWMKSRKKFNALNAPFAVYELHAGSWRYNTAENRHLNWKELAEVLPGYIADLGFTHVEFMPVMEYPYEPSWGYQLTGYFAPSSRFGSPEDFAALVDALHEREIGVILDWVPSHFPSDAHGLGMFDGTHVYEHPDPRKGYHPDWKSLIFNYGRPEVKSFLISNALYWLDQYHVDGLRVDAVASMLYLDYSRDEGEWEPNAFGGRENLEAVAFIKEMNEAVYLNYPDVQTIAEESTSFPQVTRPVSSGGLGFGMKWMMGWMNDNLRYFEKDPIYRKHHQNEVTFSLAYVFSENFMLPLSHDEVVYGKKSLLRKMPGDEWQQFANLRAMYSWMYTHPGTKLLFQGAEFGQSEEWDFSKSLDWHLLEYPIHSGVGFMLKELNHLYKTEPALHELQFSQDGFEWIDFNDNQNSVICFVRKSHTPEDSLVVVCNFTPTPISNYRIGMPDDGVWKELFNSDNEAFGGSGLLNDNPIKTSSDGWQGRAYSAEVKLPPLGVIVLKRT